MSNLIRQCEEHIEKYSGHVSSFFLTLMVVAVCGFISPALLYAAELNSSLDNPVPALSEFKPERQRLMMNTSSTSTKFNTSSPYKMEDRAKFVSSTPEQIIQYRNARIQKMITALLALEKSSASLRVELEKIQNAPTSSTSVINMGQVQKQINEILNQFKKTNFNTEFNRIKSELNTEQKKRVVVEKQEVQKRQLEMRRAEEHLRPQAPTSTVSEQEATSTPTQ